jgi:thiamine-phosphate pyrophosphorylase
MPFAFPRVYPILDSSILPKAGGAGFLDRLGRSLADAGVTLLEYRNKTGSDAEIAADCEVLRRALPSSQVKLVLDDRADLVVAMDFDGVHVDAGDPSPLEARRLLGPERIIGTFGGAEDLVQGILDAPADYLSIGPVFTTTTKPTAKSPIGIDGVRRLRGLAGPDAILVAAAGITLPTAPAVLAAGANTVAVAAAIFRAADPAAEIRRWRAALG